MDWDRISGNWPHWRTRIQERWGRLTHLELDGIAGQRERLVARLEDVYSLSRPEAERQLRNWERNLAIEQFDETEPVIEDDEDDAANVNGRG
jgi:uncharacterized protein YjbJ (UPF0337 family)